MTDRLLVVGAGFAGAVHARLLAEAGYKIDVIDARPHIAGNCFDHHDENGIRVHRYGPHLFHTNNEKVVEWIKKFGEFVSYEHRVRAQLPDGRFTPLPINLETCNMVFGTHLTDAPGMKAYLQSIAEPIDHPANAAQYLHSQIGPVLTDLFFRPYTRKMWQIDLEDMDASVVKRIPLRFDHEDRYFPNDRFQIMPRDGYTALFTRIFDHPGISVRTNVAFDKAMEGDYAHVFNSMPIDEYFENTLGELPYRSIRFHHHTIPAGEERGWSVTNYTDTGPYTRETWWHLIPHHLIHETGRRTLTREEPCDYKDNNRERYYPVKTADGRYQALYKQYQALAEPLAHMTFIGRCGTYQYLDMDQVINQSLISAQRWLEHKATR